MARSKKPAKKRSMFGDGSYIKQVEAAYTVADLIERLKMLPPDLPLTHDGIRPVWFNVGADAYGDCGEHLGLESADEWADD